MSRTPPRAARRPGAPPAPEIAWVLAGRGLKGDRIVPLEVGVGENGRIVALGRSLRAPERHDVGEAVILPSATDLHVHFRQPGMPASVESIAAGTIQAALGGIGLVADMPNNEPPIVDAEAYDSKRRLVSGRTAVDVLLYGALTARARIAELAPRVGAFKLYRSPTTGIESTLEPKEVADLLAQGAATGLPVTVHAEDPREFRPDPPATDLADWNRTRPPTAELRAVEEILRVAPTALRLHFAHVTQRTVGQLIGAAGRSFEVAPHHLLLSDRAKIGAFGKVNPPLRSEAERAALSELFAEGEVPCLASDHAPHAEAAKELPFDRAPSGMPNVETMLPLFLARVRAQELTLPRLVAAVAERPARWLGQPRGRIAVGEFADLLVVDFRRRTELRARNLRAPCGWTAFEGWEAIFPTEHYRRGQAIVRDGEYVGTPVGEIVRPDFATN